MPEMREQIVTVFGGTGFLGRRIVRRLHESGISVRIASRHPDQGMARLNAGGREIQTITTDVNDERSVAAAIAGAHGVVNAVSLYVEHGRATFQSIHVEAAARIAEQAHRAGVAQLVHVSGIGADPRSHSPYIRSRGRGELAVRAAFPAATIIRPAVMFGPNDKFLTTIAGLLRRLPAYPMFGRGATRLQPAYVGDVAAAAVQLIQSKEEPAPIYELGGPTVYSYEELLRSVARQLGVRPILLPLPFPVWRGLGYLAEMLPEPPVTRNQVQLMELDNVASATRPGFDKLGVAPRTLEHVLREIMPVATATRQ